MSGTIGGRVVDTSGSNGPVSNARVELYDVKPAKNVSCVRSVLTDHAGRFEFYDVPDGSHHLQARAFGQTGQSDEITVKGGEACQVEVPLKLGLTITPMAYTSKCDEPEPCNRAVAGRAFLVHIGVSDSVLKYNPEYELNVFPVGSVFRTAKENELEVTVPEPGVKSLEAKLRDRNPDAESGRHASVTARAQIHASEPDRLPVAGSMAVQLQRTKVPHTPDQVLWSAIRLHTKRIGFGAYREFIDRVFCGESREVREHPALERRLADVDTPINGVASYEVLKIATEAFLLTQCGVRLEGENEATRRSFLRGFETESESTRLGEPVNFEFLEQKLRQYLGADRQLPYIARVIREAFPELLDDRDNDSLLTCRSRVPCLIELIWSYWHEEGMLAQSMNAITRRFQNVHAPGERDPLAHLELDPLRPMNNVIWGFIQDEFRRLTVKRRAYEYEHHYGLTLYGKAVSHVRPADSRSKFLEAFHNLLYLCSVFFKEDNDTTVIADGYPLLNALKEVHLLLAQGAHNQFGDMPWTARSEMLVQQWILARQEIRDFLQSRQMVPYKEAWMPQVDTMKTLQGWADINVTQFRDLGVYGEQILLSVRYGDWIGINDEDSAKNWARYWRPEIQGYLHAYRAATGVDLTNPATVDATVPAIHLQKRLAIQQQRAR